MIGVISFVAVISNMVKEIKKFMHELITSELLKIFTISAKFCCNKKVKLFAVIKKNYMRRQRKIIELMFERTVLT